MLAKGRDALDHVGCQVGMSNGFRERIHDGPPRQIAVIKGFAVGPFLEPFDHFVEEAKDRLHREGGPQWAGGHWAGMLSPGMLSPGMLSPGGPHRTDQTQRQSGDERIVAGVRVHHLGDVMCVWLHELGHLRVHIYERQLS
jgi:hypothetical protein